MATLCTEIVRHLVRLDKAAQREWFAVILAFLSRETGQEVAALHDFITAEPTDDLPNWRREQLLSQIAKAVRDNDQTALTLP